MQLDKKNKFSYLFDNQYFRMVLRKNNKFNLEIDKKKNLILEFGK
jgi:hypothetical protein